MRITAISDMHGLLPEGTIPECDVLVIAGDVCPLSDHGVVFQRSWLETNFTEWLLEQPADVIVGIAGNHDFALEQYRDLGRSLPWVYLLDRQVSIDGVRFWGTPWVPNLSGWAFHLDDHRLDDKFAMIQPDTDVVVSHGPPFLHCDMTCPRFGSVNAGFPGWERVIERVEPLLFVCGHIHEAYGTSRIGATTIANVSHVNEMYFPIHLPMVFDL